MLHWLVESSRSTSPGDSEAERGTSQTSVKLVKSNVVMYICPNSQTPTYFVDIFGATLAAIFFIWYLTLRIKGWKWELGSGRRDGYGSNIVRWGRSKHHQTYPKLSDETNNSNAKLFSDWISVKRPISQHLVHLLYVHASKEMNHS